MKSIFTYAIVSLLIASCSTDSPVTSDTSANTNAGSKSDASITKKTKGDPYPAEYLFPACGEDFNSLFMGTETRDIIEKGNGKTLIYETDWSGSSGDNSANSHSIETYYFPNWPETCPRTWTYEYTGSATGPGGVCCYNYSWVIEYDQNCNVVSDVYTGPFDCNGDPL